MIIGVFIEMAVGAACAVLGLLLWKKQRVSLLHDYHYKNVKKEDLPAYCRQMGVGILLVGAGIILTGILNLARSSLWWVSLTAGIALGIAVLYRAQKKYNGSVMG